MSKPYSFECLLQTLYNSIVEPAALSEFLELACEATNSHVGSLHIHDTRTGIEAAEFIGIPTDAAVAYNVRYTDTNVLIQNAVKIMRTGLVCTSEDLVSLDELKATVYYREWLGPIDVDHCLGLCGLADASDLVILSLARSHSRGAYIQSDRRLLHRIAPHWLNSLRIRQQLGTLHDTVTTLEAALNRITLAVLFIDGEGQVTRVNHGAECLLARGDVIALQNGQLVARYALDARPLHHAIDAATRTTAALPDAPTAPSRAGAPLLLHDARGIPAVYLGVHPLTIRASDPARVAAAQAVVFLRPLDAGNPCNLADAVGELFGLTSAEARLAVNLHCTGDLALASQKAGITLDAARTRLKTVFDKTGVHGQPALARLLSELKCVLGPS